MTILYILEPKKCKFISGQDTLACPRARSLAGDRNARRVPEPRAWTPDYAAPDRSRGVGRS